MSQTLTLEVCEGLFNEGVQPICPSTQQRYIEQEGLWSLMKERAPLLVKRTAKWWKWFENDEFEYVEEIDEKGKSVTVHLTGPPNLGSDDLAFWFQLIDYQLLGKGHHENFEEGMLARYPVVYSDQQKVLLSNLGMENIEPVFDYLYIHLQLPEKLRDQYECIG